LIVNPLGVLTISSAPPNAPPSQTFAGRAGPPTISGVLIWKTPVSVFTGKHVVPLTSAHDGVSLILLRTMSAPVSAPSEVLMILRAALNVCPTLAVVGQPSSAIETDKVANAGPVAQSVTASDIAPKSTLNVRPAATHLYVSHF
jgi:hypothetical protein